ncbi:MAG: class I SAM-dependent methyltransferase [Kutzneria sp.]|nr:class I SAM-dependent methyltransferase [Kutzneria sp.]MBV9844996.1 class I SAM-dependent methyltransferase [Kutzneria sp.]
MDPSLAQRIADLGAWLRLGPLLTEYLPCTARELRPAGLTTVLDEILVGARSVLVECGCGSSSVVVARLLARRGFGHLLSLEHDERQAAFVCSQLRRESLGHVAKVVHAPLARHPAALGRAGWYSPRLVYDEVSDYVDQHGLIDLLLVDGPVGDELVRYPALPVLHRVLAPGAVVLLDDIGQPGELTVMNRWRREFGLRFHTNRSARLGCAVLTL